MKPALILAFAFPFLIVGARAAQEPSAAGFWQQTDEQGNVGGWFYFVEKNGVYEGRLVKAFLKPGEQVVPNCLKCEGDQKNAAMIGLVIVKKMKRTGLKYDEGSILDPRDGSVYHAQMEVSPDGQKLSVRGYLGIPMLGQTQVWTRLPDNVMAAADIPKESLSPGLKPKEAATPAPKPKEAAITTPTKPKDTTAPAPKRAQ
jgi:uncharacterized protein (DUF2147 family)